VNEISPEVVKDQLNCILSSSDFESTHQLSQFLQFVVEETLAGRADQIKAYTIATSVLGRKSDYDPQADATVRILAGRLRTRLEHYYSQRGKNDPIRISIPKGRYVPFFQLNESDENHANAQIDQAELADASHRPSIAVLPLANLNGNPEEDYFAQGLTEQLIIALSSYPSLLVLPRYATLGYKDQAADVNQIGNALGIRFIMEGSVRKVGQTLRVNVYLSDILTRRQIWAQAYERNLTLENLLSVQDEIAQNVTVTIGDIYGGVIPRIAIAGKESHIREKYESLTAYDASLHFMYFFSEMNSDNYSRTRQVLEQAHKENPDDPELCAMLSTIFRAGYGMGFSDENNPLDKVLYLARKAVSLDPLSQTARSALAGAYQLARDRQGVIRESEALLSLKPPGTLFAVAAWNIALAGEWERGLAILREQMEMLQYYPGWFHTAGFLDYYRRSEYEAALKEAHMMNLPTVMLDPLQRAAALGQLGRTKRGRRTIAELLELRPDFAADPRRYLNWLIPFDELVDHLLEGIEKAGLSLS